MSPHYFVIVIVLIIYNHFVHFFLRSRRWHVVYMWTASILAGSSVKWCQKCEHSSDITCSASFGIRHFHHLSPRENEEWTHSTHVLLFCMDTCFPHSCEVMILTRGRWNFLIGKVSFPENLYHFDGQALEFECISASFKISIVRPWPFRFQLSVYLFYLSMFLG